jgi:hypothetical protein
MEQELAQLQWSTEERLLSIHLQKEALMAELEYWVCFEDVTDPARVVDPIGEGFFGAGVKRVFVGSEAEQRANDLAYTFNQQPEHHVPGNIRAYVEAFYGI